jgi:hypothetical protein
MGIALGYIDDEMEEDDDDGVSINTDGNEMDEFQATHQAQQTAALKKDFLEIVAADWRPGLIRSGSNEFGQYLPRPRCFSILTIHSVVCVSCPVIKVYNPCKHNLSLLFLAIRSSNGAGGMGSSTSHA